MVWNNQHNPSKQKRSQLWLVFILLMILAVSGLVLFTLFDGDEKTVSTSETENTQTQQSADIDEVPEEIPDFDADKLQKVVDDWLASISGSASVVITNAAGEILAENEPDRSYFAASIYKIFVAHEGYGMVDRGEVNPNETYINGHTRAECLDLMIRESDSPCAEKLWNEIGKQFLTDKLVSYGIENTSMVAVTTTAEDAATMLGMIARGDGLSDESRDKYLVSMRDQIYRDAFNKGFSENSVVMNKIGFNGVVEYHDTAIVIFEDSRQLIVSVLTERVGSSNIARLGTLIEDAVLSN